MTERPQYVHCRSCSYEWVAAFLPMEAGRFGRVLKAARCAKCGLGGKRLGLGPLPKPTVDGDWRAWMQNGDTGISSKTIWSVMTGCPVESDGIPYDPSDFGRCYRLLKVMPSWRPRMSEVAERFPKWKPLVDAWDELTALYEDELLNGPVVRGSRMAPKTFDRMKELIG